MNASPTINYNTVIKGDSNGIFITGNSRPDLTGNILAFNGRGNRGRGICIFGNGAANLTRNLFFRNRIEDLAVPSLGGNLTIEELEAINPEPDIVDLAENISVNPRFRNITKFNNLRFRPNSQAGEIGAGFGSFPIFE